MLKVEFTIKFKKDYKRCIKQNRNMSLLKDVMKDLEVENVLNEKLKDHPLVGNYNDYRECHIQPDWLLIYKLTGQMVIFARTGSHSELF